MKFIVSSTALSSHLQAISRVINSKNALPILDCFLFELEDGTLSVTVSDSASSNVFATTAKRPFVSLSFTSTVVTMVVSLSETVTDNVPSSNSKRKHCLMH